MALTKAQRIAVAKKAARTRKRNASSSSAPRRKPSRRTVSTRRRSAPRSKGMLSELFNPKMAQGTVKSMFSGAVGGFGAVTLVKMTPNQSPITQAAIIGGTAFVAGSMLKMPNVAAGMAAIAVYRLMENAGMLAEDMALADYADPIEELPIMLNEDGSPNFALAESDMDMMLSESYQVALAPPFGGVY